MPILSDHKLGFCDENCGRLKMKRRGMELELRELGDKAWTRHRSVLRGKHGHVDTDI